MAYDKSSGLITAPVSIHDLQRCLRTIVTVSGRRQLSGDLGYIIANGAINKWAKYKPVVNTKIGVLSDSDFKNKLNIGIGQCSLYGISIRAVSDNTFPKIAEFYKIGANWVYTRPSGGADSPYRLSDFSRYCHIVEPVAMTGYKQGEIQTLNINREPYPKFTVYFEDADIYTVKITDFDINPFELNDNAYPISEGYLAVWVVPGTYSSPANLPTSSNFPLPVVCQTKIKDGGFYVNINSASITFTEGSEYTLVGGIVFGSANQYAIGLPVESGCYPMRCIRVVKTWDISTELRAWAQSPSYVWHEYRDGDASWWQETEDTVAWPTSGSTVFSIGLYISNQNTVALTSASRIWIYGVTEGTAINGQGIFYADKACTVSSWSIASGSAQMLYANALTFPVLSNNESRTYIVRLENAITGTELGRFVIQGSSRLG